MSGRSKVTVDSTGIVLWGSGYTKDDVTLERDAARVADLAQFTVLAKKASNQKYVPLSDIDSARTPAKLVCGALGCTIPELAAVSDAEFGLTVDGELISITGLDFSGLDAEDDTPGYFTCGANGGNVAAYAAVADGSVRVTVNGVNHDLTGLDFNTVAVTALQQVADVINYAANGAFFCEYDLATDTYKFISPTTGETSSVALGSVGSGTDISAAGFLNAAGGAATAGTGGEGTLQTPAGIINAAAAGRFYAAYNGDAMVFWSPTEGLPGSSITALSDQSAGGTYIGGASYLNGETGTGVITAATGGNAVDYPAAIFIGDTIAAATLAAADVTNQKIWFKGDPLCLNEDDVVLEGSLTLDTVIVGLEITIRDYLEREMHIFTRDATIRNQVAPV